MAPSLLGLAVEAAFQLSFFVPWVGALVLSWKLVGINVSFKSMFVFQAYFFGAFLPMFPFGLYIIEGLKQTYGQTAYQIAGTSIFILISLWAIFCWNVYRHLFGASFLKAVISGILALITTTGFFFVANSIVSLAKHA